MKLVQINHVCGRGSTGKICVGISELATQSGIDNRIFYSNNLSDYSLSVKYGNEKYIKIQALKSRIFGNYGFNSNVATKRVIKELERYNPDVVHIHNIHGHDVNFERLFDYLRKKNKKVVYTFHDCWAFTGYCPYFTMAKCDKWKTTCNHCPLRKEYSWFFDKSKKNFERKKKALSGLDLTVVTPSKWLADLVKKSFLKDYPVKVINNGIDLNIFKPTESDFRSKYRLENKKVLLSVADMWGKRKGLDVFIELSKRLADEYKIVLVGTTEAIDKQLPSNILSIHRTQNQTELAEIYSAADLFVNPTREENYPTVNMESIACGTPVLTFRTGGSPEILDETCGSVVDCDDIDGLEKEIIRICETRPYSKETCLKRAKSFDMKDRFKEYIELYEQL